MIFKELYEKYMSTIIYKDTKLKPFINKLQSIPSLLRIVIEINFIRYNPYNPKNKGTKSLDDVTELFDSADFKSFTIDFRGKSTTFYRIMINDEDFTEDIQKSIYKFNYLDSDIIVSIINLNQKEERKMIDMIPLELDCIVKTVFDKDDISPFVIYILASYAYLDSVYIESDEHCKKDLAHIIHNINGLSKMLSRNPNNGYTVSEIIFDEYKDGTKISYILDYGFISFLKYKITEKLGIDTTIEKGWE